MDILTWIDTLFHSLHGAQKKTLAVFVAALLKGQNVCLAETARVSAELSDGTARAALKRLWRFLRNTRFHDAQISRDLAQWIWPRFASWRHIPISIDWTHNERRGEWCTLAASVSLAGRGIPLLMHSYRKADYDRDESRNRCEEAFLGRLLSLLPSDDRIVIVADRGFGRTTLLAWLHGHDTHYVIRVARGVKVRSTRFTGVLRHLKVHNGECYSLGRTRFRSDSAILLTQLVVARQQHESKQPDPWFLATDLTQRAGSITKLYARRMIIEQDFREAKSRLDWSDSRIRKLSHYRRLTTLVLVVLVFAAFVGRVAQRRPALAGKVARKRKGRWDHGVTALGLALLRRDLTHVRLIHQLKFPSQPT